MGCTGGTRKEKGRRRAEWTDGKKGTDGKNGTDGKKGTDGKNGTDGKKGIVIPQDSSYNNMEETSCGKPQGERSGKHV